MASNINPTNIDGTYPIAGQDNDSQGFRDNFTNIKMNLQYSKTELEDLQSKVLLKRALIGTVLENDLNYAVLFRPQLKAPVDSFREFPGTQNSTVTVSFLDTVVQRINTSGPLTINLVDFPPGGHWGSVKVWLHVMFGVNQTFVDVILPQTVTLGIKRLLNADGFTYNDVSKTVTFTTPGDYLYEFSTADNGNNFWINQVG